MKNSSRIALSVIALPVAFVCSIYPFLFIFKSIDKSIILIGSIFVAVFISAILWWATHNVTEEFLPKFTITTFIIGGIGFLIGFVGPILFTDSNQGPLLGIFITGPLSIVFGALFSGIYWKLKLSTHKLNKKK